LNANSEFKCSFCHQKHRAPSQAGFPPYLGLLKIFKTRADHVRHYKNVEELHSKQAELKSKSDSFEANFQNGTDQIKE
jgi:hypothetical protein